MADGTPPRPANAACPRCGGAFRCGVADPGPCACSTLTLPPALRDELARRWPGGCLCLGCLQALRDAAAAPAG